MTLRFPIAFLFLANIVIAQTNHYSNFMFTKSVYNPASIGSEYAIDATALYRNQWLGIKGNPTMQMLSVHSPLNILNSSAGIFVVNEMQGEERATFVMFSLAYRKPFKAGNLSVGASGGFIQKSLNGSNLRAPEGAFDGTGNYSGHGDDFIPAELVSDFSGDVSAGIYYDWKKLYTGLSVTNILESKVILDTESGQTEIRFPRSYVFTGGYKFVLGKKLNLQTHVLLKTDFIKTQADLNVMVQYKNNIYAGVSFRGGSKNTNDALVTMLGFTLFKKIQIGYSYDFSISSLNNVNSGSHEVFVNYKIGIKELFSPGKIIYNPRFL